MVDASGAVPGYGVAVAGYEAAIAGKLRLEAVGSARKYVIQHCHSAGERRRAERRGAIIERNQVSIAGGRALAIGTERGCQRNLLACSHTRRRDAKRQGGSKRAVSNVHRRRSAGGIGSVTAVGGDQ